MDLLSFLRFLGLPEDKEVKIYQHVNNGKVVIQDLIDNGEFEKFQSYHSGSVLGRGYLVSFVKEVSGLSRFLGVWRVTLREKKAHPTGGPRLLSEYDLSKLEQFDEYSDRITIKWPPGRANHRWLFRPGVQCPKFDVEQVRQKGFFRDFPGFSSLVLSHRELVKVVNHPSEVPGWTSALKSTRAVYLIANMDNGDLYVGSATGLNGLWGRWKNYANNGHGGNKLMIVEGKVMEAPLENRRYSILETFSNLATRQQGIETEELWKKKLGKGAVRLNATR